MLKLFAVIGTAVASLLFGQVGPAVPASFSVDGGVYNSFTQFDAGQPSNAVWATQRTSVGLIVTVATPTATTVNGYGQLQATNDGVNWANIGTGQILSAPAAGTVSYAFTADPFDFAGVRLQLYPDAGNGTATGQWFLKGLGNH